MPRVGRWQEWEEEENQWRVRAETERRRERERESCGGWLTPSLKSCILIEASSSCPHFRERESGGGGTKRGKLNKGDQTEEGMMMPQSEKKRKKKGK
jgi:hypothetical protein